MQGEDEEADWDLELMNEEDDGVVHWVSGLHATLLLPHAPFARRVHMYHARSCLFVLA